MPISLFMALQFLREGRTQSLLISAAVGVGVAVIVFLSALIGGLQADLIAKTLGTQAHVVLERPEERARPLLATAGVGDAQVLTRVEQTAQRVRSITGWQQLVDELERTPGVAAVSPVSTGPGLAVRGSVSKAIVLLGIQPERFVRVIDLQRRLVAGRLPRSGTEASIGVELARGLGLELGDKLRVQAAGGRTELLVVVGLFELGNREVDERWVVVPLRAGQTLLDQVGSVSVIQVRLPDPFDANDIAAELQGRTGLEARSWMRTNAQLLTALRSQSSSSYMIQFFVVLAVTIGIASVLVVSVVQRRRQIGILRAMGTSRARIGRVFLLQGGILGLVGSVAGVGLGAAIARLFQQAAVDPKGNPLFPIELDPQLMLTAAAIAVGTGLLAAALPAMRAAGLDPAVAIRHE